MSRPDLKQTILTPCASAGGTFSYTGTAGASGVLPKGCSGCFVWGTTAIYVKLGTDAVAATTDWPIPANVPVFLPNLTDSGANVVVSAVRISTSGDAYYQAVA